MEYVTPLPFEYMKLHESRRSHQEHHGLWNMTTTTWIHLAPPKNRRSPSIAWGLFVPVGMLPAHERPRVAYPSASRLTGDSRSFWGVCTWRKKLMWDSFTTNEPESVIVGDRDSPQNSFHGLHPPLARPPCRLCYRHHLVIRAAHTAMNGRQIISIFDFGITIASRPADTLTQDKGNTLTWFNFHQIKKIWATNELQ